MEKSIKQRSPTQQPPTQQPLKRKKIFVCSPYRPISTTLEEIKREQQENEERIKLACRLIVTLGHMPMCPHGYFTHFLNDSIKTDRERGIALGMVWLAESDEMWVFGERISDGMAEEIAFAKANGIPVICKPEPEVLIKSMLEELGKEYGTEKENDTEKVSTAVGAETEENNGK